MMNEIDNINIRDTIIYEKYRPTMYKFDNRRKFEGLDVDRLNQLINNGFVKIDSHKSLAPTVGEVQSFMSEYPKYKAHGYTTMKDIIIEGVEKGEQHESIDEFQRYMEVFRFSDVFNHTTMYCLFN